MNIHQTVEFLQTLPALPKIAQDILSINLASDAGDELLLKLIAKDPPISARVIGLANSPIFHTSRKILTVNDASAVLGIKRIKMISLSFAMVASMTRKPPGSLDTTALGQHGMAVSLAMEVLSRAMPHDRRPPDEELYLAGLLHNIGFLVLDYTEPVISNRFHARLAAEDGRIASTELEAQILEVNHCELGALLAEHWNLTANIIAVIRHHHHIPDNSGESVANTLIAMTCIAQRLLPTFGAHELSPPPIQAKEWQALGITDVETDELVSAMRACLHAMT